MWALKQVKQMTIKFHRPVYDLGIEPGDVRTMDASQEFMYVSRNCAEYCMEEPKEAKPEPTEPKPKKVKK